MKRLLLATAVLATACTPPAPVNESPMPTTTTTTDTTPSTTEAPTTTVPAPVEVEPEPPAVPVPVTEPEHVHPPITRPRTATTVYEPPAQGRTTRGDGRCGGDLPPCSVMQQESGGDPRAVNPSSGAAGKWQFMPSTSRSLGYSRPMNEYDEATQDEAARALWRNGAGCSHWNAC